VILTAGVAHPRTVIRHAVVSNLTGETSAGTRVQGTRIDPERKTRLPAISVYCTKEPVDVDTSSQTAPRVLYRQLELEIGAWVPGTANPEDDIGDALDAMCLEIEVAMDADRFLGGRQNGLVQDTILKNTEFGLQAGKNGDPFVGVVTLTYLVTYNTSAAQLATDDFLRVHSKTRMPGVEDANAAVDDFNVRST
jgi:hypothetical protein